MYKRYNIIPLVFLIFFIPSNNIHSKNNDCLGCILAINQTLNQLHRAASDANSQVYFSLFTANANFIGTDPKETWTIKQFKAFAEPYFNKGTGWTYHSRDRHITISESKQTAWFDEMLDNKKYGETRGTGVLVRAGRDWKIAQYHLTLPIPNSLTSAVVKMIQNNEQ